MTDNVVSLADRRQSSGDEHQSGPAVCAVCRHEWAAVAPVGVAGLELECPACGTHRGAFKHLTTRPGKLWECRCGSDLFRLAPDGAYCAVCAGWATGWVE